jgi:hypothetical protein
MKNLVWLGSVSSINASLAMLIADARTASAWCGIDENDNGEADSERAALALADETTAVIDVGGAPALLLDLHMGHGVAFVYRAEEALLVVEAFLDVKRDDPSFLEHLARPLDDGAEEGASVSIVSGEMVLTCVSDLSAEGLRVTLGNGVYRAFIEPEKKGAWGAARRALITAELEAHQTIWTSPDSA